MSAVRSRIIYPDKYADESMGKLTYYTTVMTTVR